jgi:hypothetical protein
MKDSLLMIQAAPTLPKLPHLWLPENLEEASRL